MEKVSRVCVGRYVGLLRKDGGVDRAASWNLLRSKHFSRHNYQDFRAGM